MEAKNDQIDGPPGPIPWSGPSRWQVRSEPSGPPGPQPAGVASSQRVSKIADGTPTHPGMWYEEWDFGNQPVTDLAEPHRVSRRLDWLGDNGVMGRLMMYSPEVRERAVRLVLEHRGEHRWEWVAICSIAEKFGCSSETLRKWVRRAETDQGLRPGLTSPERERLRALERENRELRRANEILRKASAYFAQAELDRRPRG